MTSYSMPSWIGVDLDGTLAVYSGWLGPTYIGTPVPLMVRRVQEWLRRGMKVKIFTARVAEPDPQVRAEIVAAIEAWCEEYIGEKLEVTCTKDFGMTELWDDRAIQVIPNSGRRADGEDA